MTTTQLPFCINPDPSYTPKHIGEYGLFKDSVSGNYVICRSVKLYYGPHAWAVHTDLAEGITEPEAIKEVLRCIDKEDSFGE